jgi:cystathionine beta-lyase family protein involved in aluminum resistance
MTDLLAPLLTSDALRRALGGRELHPRVHAAALNVAEYFMPRPEDIALRAAATTRVLDAVLAEDITEADLAGTTGYGYHDTARERYEGALARVYCAEAALARLSIVSGTHAIMLALGAVTPIGTRLIAASGKPYDTLHNGIAQAPGCLVEQGIIYEQIMLDAAGKPDLVALAEALSRPGAAPVGSIFLQRSRGYAPRPSLSIADITAVAACIRMHAPKAVLLVDNCYCELVEEREPLEVGADLVMGSLIKNLGGGIAPAGGYVAGRAALIDKIATRLYAPGLGSALGPTLGLGRLFFQGLMLSPQIVWESLRGLRFAAALFQELGVSVDPLPDAPRRDIVQALRLGNRRRVEAASQALQRILPVNARFRPEAGAVPGYVDDVIMSGGAFVGGATIELSCDAPLREPYELYLQGGMSAEHVVLGAALMGNALVELL